MCRSLLLGNWQCTKDFGIMPRLIEFLCAKFLGVCVWLLLLLTASLIMSPRTMKGDYGQLGVLSVGGIVGDDAGAPESAMIFSQIALFA